MERFVPRDLQCLSMAAGIGCTCHTVGDLMWWDTDTSHLLKFLLMVQLHWVAASDGVPTGEVHPFKLQCTLKAD